MPKTNQQMCEIVTLRGKVRNLTTRESELVKGLNRAIREIKNLGGERYVINKLEQLIDE